MKATAKQLRLEIKKAATHYQDKVNLYQDYIKEANGWSDSVEEATYKADHYMEFATILNVIADLNKEERLFWGEKYE